MTLSILVTHTCKFMYKLYILLKNQIRANPVSIHLCDSSITAPGKVLSTQ